MRNEWFKRNKWIFFVAPLAIVLFTYLFGELVMHLWNWLLPALFGWRQISFWQALGLLVLCRILFGGFGGNGSKRARSRRALAERWEQMTPEEREKFRQGMGSRCGGFRTPSGETREPA
jgi:glycine/D-amino acid oxidase-like deaminating enzyme